jgi:pre-mRNA-processing factor 19
MLSTFQTEWDAVMLETFNLKKNLDVTRQQLSLALYQHDAACRVIARVVKERDEARSALSNAEVVLSARGLSVTGDASAMVTPSGGGGITEAVLAAMKDASKKLGKARKKRSIPEDLTPIESISKLAAIGSHTFHRSDKPGVLGVNAASAAPGRLLTAGADHTAKVFDLGSEQVTSTLTGHSKKLTVAVWGLGGSSALTASKDGTLRVWAPGADGALAVTHTVSPHGGAEVGTVDIQPSGAYAVTSSPAKAGWAVVDLASGVVLGEYGTEEEPASAACLHVDGVLYAVAGSDGPVRVYDLRTQNVVATFEDTSAPLTCITFSENGYSMAGAGADGHVHVWNLRTLKKATTVEVAGAVSALAWDNSGSYLAVGSGDSKQGCISVFLSKEWSQLWSSSTHKGAVTGLQWAPLAASLVASSTDNSVSVWSTVSQ